MRNKKGQQIGEQQIAKKGTDAQVLNYLHGYLQISNVDAEDDILYRLRNIIMGLEEGQRTKFKRKGATVDDMINKLTKSAEEG